MRPAQVAPAVQYVPAYQQQQGPAGALHAELSADGTKIVLMTAGSDWDRKRIADLLAKLTYKPDGTGTGAVTVPATWANAVQLGWTLRDTGLAWAPRERLRDWMAAECARRLAEPPPLEKSWPDGLEPRDYQVTDARQIAQAGKFLLLHDPGLGKTAITILGVEQRYRTGISIFPMVILVPSWTVADVWVREIAQWLPGGQWGVPALYGGPGRLALLEDPRVKVLITTYATARRDADSADAPLARLGARTVIADESHLIKNARAAQSAATERIARRAVTVGLLSGTFITRDMGDAFPGLKAMDRLSWPSKERFRDRFCLTRKDEYAETITGLNPHTEPEFRACLLGQLTRRAKADVLPELPPKIYSVRHPVVPPEWTAAYRQMEQDMLAAIPDGAEEMSAFDTLTQLTRLSQLASCAADVGTEAVTGKDGEVVLDEITGLPKTRQVVTLRSPCWKAEALLEILAERPGQGVAVFMDSRALAMITGEKYLRPAGYRYGYVTGTGSGVTKMTRRTTVEEFQDGKLDVIVCTNGAGGLGITLTRAGTVVFLQRSWEFDKFIQPEDRAQRIGAEQFSDHIEVIDLVARNTVDQRRRESAKAKAGQLGQFLKDPRLVRELLGGKR